MEAEPAGKHSQGACRGWGLCSGPVTPAPRAATASQASQAQQPLDTHLGEQTLGPTPRRSSHRLWAVYSARAVDSLPHFQGPSGAFSLAPSSASTTSLLTPCPVSLSLCPLSPYLSSLNRQAGTGRDPGAARLEGVWWEAGSGLGGGCGPPRVLTAQTIGSPSLPVPTCARGATASRPLGVV